MTKIRVYELARDLKTESKSLIVKMKALGIEVPSHQSALSAAQIEKIRAFINKENDTKPKVVLRRKREEEVVSSEEATEDTEVQAHPVLEVVPSHPRVSEIIFNDEYEPRPRSVEEKHSVEAQEHPEKPTTVVERKMEKREEPASVAPHSSHVHTPAPTESPSTDTTSAAVLRRRSFSEGATIVRKATAEDLELSRNRDLARAKLLNRDQARPSSHPQGSRPPYRSSPGGGAGGDFARRDPRDGGGGAFPFNRPPAAGGEDFKGAPPADKGDINKWNKGKKEVKSRRDEEEAAASAAKAAAATSTKRKSFSTRDLLYEAFAEERDEEVGPTEEELAAAKRKRTVYTPSASQRKKDIKRRKDLKSTSITTPRAAYRVVKMTEPTISVSELAHQMSVKASEVIGKLMSQGMMVTINQAVDFDTATLMATEYGFECKLVGRTSDDFVRDSDLDHSDERIRPPIVTVMGHVDHGKTSILDVIRSADIAANEAGGITQHIGAYTIQKGDFKVAFLDTPGHAAFSAMRARGAQLTDIVVLVVAADDGVMPQTIEAISHARSAEVPIIVAINKIDKHNVNFDRIYKELSAQGITSEEWGGETQFIKVSALKKLGIDELISAIHVQAEVLELKAPYAGRADGVVIEAHLDKGRGPVATVMVTRGKLQTGDFVVAGTSLGRVRAMVDHHGAKVDEAYPSTPVQIFGLTNVPMAGDKVNALEEKQARDLADVRENEHRQSSVRSTSVLSLEDLIGKVNANEIPQVPIIIKGDTQGSVEAISEALTKLNNKSVRSVVIHKAVGGINENDLSLAETCSAVIFGFNVRAIKGLQEHADKRGVVVKYFSVIYDLVDTMKSLLAGRLPPICTEVVQGHAEVRNAISIPKLGVIAGSSVIDGKITRNCNLRLIREQIVIYNGKIGSLRRFKEDVKEVQNGYECGIGIDGYQDIRVGDVIEAFVIEEKAATLELEA